MRPFILAAALSALAATSPSHAASPFDGTWKTDLATAQFSKKPDIYILKAGEFTCKSCVPAFTIKADGTPQPVTGHPYYDTVAIKVVSPTIVHETRTRAGKTVGDVTETVSADGKTLTFKGTNTNFGTGTPVTFSGTDMRVSAGPAHAHAISGAWRTQNYANVSDNGTTFTMKISGDALTYKAGSGFSYTAKLDGTAAPVTGDPGADTVSLKKAGADTLIETDSLKGKVVFVGKMTVSADGKVLTMQNTSKVTGRTSTLTAKKS